MKDMEFYTEEQAQEKDFETRRLVDISGTTKEFKFFVIDSPEKWQDACDLSAQYKMPLNFHDKYMRFNLKGISLKDWESIEVKHKNPFDGKRDDELSEEDKELVKSIENKKKIELLEIATGKIIPGETEEDKIDFLESRSPGEVDALLRYTTEVLTGYVSGRILEEWSILSREIPINTTEEVKDFESFEDWNSATETQYILRIQRPFQKFILEFPMKSISSKDKEVIENETKISEPPLIPKRNPGGSFDPSQTEPNYNDPSWMKKTRALSQKRIAMYFDKCLSFSIPGNDTLEKYRWISEKLVGDVLQIKNFIEDDMIGYRSRYNFFTISSDQRS